MNLDKNYFSVSETRYVYLDGRICADLDVFYSDLARQLHFPEYFGRNLDSLDEMLSDLEWVEEKKVHILLYHAFAFLSTLEGQKEEVLDILKNPENKRIEFSII